MLCLLGPLLFKGTTQEKREQHTNFFSFSLLPFTQLPITFLHIHIKNTYSLPGCCHLVLTFGPFLLGGGDTSTTSGDGGGTFTTSGDNLMEITSSSLQHKIKHSTNTHYMTQHSSNSIKQPVYHNYTHKTANVDRIPFSSMERTIKFQYKVFHITKTTMQHIQTDTSMYINLCA